MYFVYHITNKRYGTLYVGVTRDTLKHLLSPRRRPGANLVSSCGNVRLGPGLRRGDRLKEEFYIGCIRELRVKR